MLLMCVLLDVTDIFAEIGKTVRGDGHMKLPPFPLKYRC
jgi:hypothetical protein